LVKARTPVIVGVGQVTNKRHSLIDPMTLMEEATRLANDDAGGRALDRVQSIQVVNSLSGRYAAPATALARRLSVADGERLTTQVGGSTPQWLVNEASQRIADGEFDGVLIVGAEAVDSMRRARRAGTTIHMGDAKDAPPDKVIGDDRIPMSPQELSAQVIVPIQIYPMFEQAIAAEKGRTLDEQRTFLGEIMAPFTKIAASYPELAWFPEERTPSELSEVSEDNRMIAEPYPKNLNAIMQVDMGAALILMSAEAAEAAGVPRDRWVFPWAGAKCDDSLWAAQRLEYARSPALEAAAGAALDAACIGVGDVAFFDLYSCFPCSVEMSADAVGVAVDDPRGLTVTGGLLFFGGPGNNYVSHAVATMAQRLRAEPGAIGYVSGVSYYMSKHSVGVYSATPPPNGWRYADTKAIQQELDAQIPEIAPEADGDALVNAFTVEWDREGPVRAPVYATLPDGRRVVATPDDAGLPKELSGRSIVGEKVHVRNGEGGVVYELL
jgi:acetyl-CoA C-acetyltransferase